ncbi:integrase catalytic domain-containing protein [Trichonephila inaurata madagascariensis]|uniref:Integrase catalytic domain-containing protein n=1 Tax=Trichonephila inaurata madagascariensis TaxID=2747483 RepID=A0A8X6Y1V1_9ARAC|nr:integrase catalytic domain-containing protein [Trichonephila inaurata madagascariensis]GFY64526.1 integrase catalytic domain-containing protein [Trichonephila inaurata madagascariensis]
MRSFITKKLSKCLGFPAIRKEKLSVYTFGNKIPIEKDYVVKLTLKNKDSPNLKIDIEALVTDQILAVNIPPLELDNIPQAVQLENLVLADSSDCQEPITILIGAGGYYYDNYLKLGLLELVPNSDSDSNNVTFYLPQVIRKDRPSSQLRIAYDASSHDANSPSLNSCLHVGPNLYPEIFDILLRFRQNAVAFTVDMKIKHLMQKKWFLGVEWNESLPDDIISFWPNWCEEVPQLIDFSIPRCYFSDSLVNNFKTLELHLFSDASTKAYGTVAYLRVTSSNKEILTSFVTSKNKIAPLKTLTLPRLELMGALLSTRLSSNIWKALKLDIPCFFWTDSKIT